MPPAFRRAAVFFALACLLSWGVLAVARGAAPELPATAVYAVYMFGPLVAALIAAGFVDRGPVLDLLALKARWSWWWVPAWLLPPVLCAAAWGLTLLMPGVEAQSFSDGAAQIAAAQGVAVPPGTLEGLPPTWLLIVGATIAGGALNTLAAIGEEAGWRGYLWSVLRPLGFWRATLIIGIVWGLWHAPIIVAGHNYGVAYAGYPWLGIGMMVLFTTALSPLLGLLRERTGSAWPPALFHGTLNAVSGIFLLMQTGAHPLLGGIVGLAGVLVAAVVAVVILLLRRSSGLADGRAGT